MTIDAGTIVWLLVGALALSALAVVLDRMNFPQRPFRAKQIAPGQDGPKRDRTGAHIVELDETPDDQGPEQSGFGGATEGEAES